MYQSYGFKVSTIPYSESQPATPKSWNSNFCPISIFGSYESKIKDVKNIKLSILYIRLYQKAASKNDRESDISCLEGFRQIVFSLISAIYKSSWDASMVGENNKIFYIKMTE